MVWIWLLFQNKFLVIQQWQILNYRQGIITNQDFVQYLDFGKLQKAG